MVCEVGNLKAMRKLANKTIFASFYRLMVIVVLVLTFMFFFARFPFTSSYFTFETDNKNYTVDFDQ